MTATDPPAQPPAATPPDEVLRALARFERGDFLGARTDLDALLATNPSAAVADAARDILGRMTPDPWALRIGLGALALLILLSLAYLR